MAQGDNNDGAGLAGQQDPTWYVWAKDNIANVFNADHCEHTTNQYNAWWNIPDFTLITGTNTLATQITIEMECWENDCSGNCSYESTGSFLSSCWVNPDDNYTGRAVANSGLIDFRNDPACTWNEYDVWLDGNGSLPDYGQYWAKIEIKWEYASFSAGSDDAVCDSSLTLAGEGNGTWSVTSGSGGSFSDNSDPNSTFTGQAGQIYALTWQTLTGCINSTNSDVVYIEIYGLPDPQLSSSTDSICEGDTVTFTAQNGINYDWSINSGGSVFQSGSTNTYTTDSLIQADTVYVEITDGNNCTATDFYTIDVSAYPNLTMDNDTSIFDGESITINGYTSNFVSYLWNTNETTSSITVIDSGIYILTIENSYGCSVTDSITITILNNNLFLPNMFSPNNDGQNDILLIYGTGLDEDISFKIYNRWGNVVYETNLLSELQTIGWDGKYNGIDQPSGVYLYTLIANDLSGNPVNFDLLLNLKSSGSILLKR